MYGETARRTLRCGGLMPPPKTARFVRPTAHRGQSMPISFLFAPRQTHQIPATDIGSGTRIRPRPGQFSIFGAAKIYSMRRRFLRPLKPLEPGDHPRAETERKDQEDCNDDHGRCLLHMVTLSATTRVPPVRA